MGSSCQPCEQKIFNCCKPSIIENEVINEKETSKKDTLTGCVSTSSILNGTLFKNKRANFCYEKRKERHFKSEKMKSFKLLIHQKDFLLKSLKSTVVFGHILDEELELLIGIIYKIECKVGQEIVNLGNPIVFFFVVLTGKFVVHDYDRGEELKELLPESTFGENSILQVEKLNGSIECIEEAIIFGINRKDYQAFIKERNEARLKDKLIHLKNCDAFSKKY